MKDIIVAYDRTETVPGRAFLTSYFVQVQVIVGVVIYKIAFIVMSGSQSTRLFCSCIYLNRISGEAARDFPPRIIEKQNEKIFPVFIQVYTIHTGKATLLAITENGFGKRTELDEYRVQKRGGRGVITYKITPKTGKIVGVRIATEEDDVMLITDKGTIIRINVKDVSILGRSTQGVTLMRTNDGGKVVSIETLTPDIENE